MKKVYLNDYFVKVAMSEGTKEVSYNVRNSLCAILFHPELKLGGRDLLEAGKLSDKIEFCKDDAILLEESEYKRLVSSLEIIKGFGKNEVELVKRVFEAPEVSVREAN